MAKFFHHDVGELILSAHELDIDVAILNALRNVMVLGLDMLAPIVEDRVLHQSNVVPKQLTEKPLEANTLARHDGRSDVLHFT
jgi:hypothetical protein